MEPSAPSGSGGASTVAPASMAFATVSSIASVAR